MWAALVLALVFVGSLAPVSAQAQELPKLQLQRFRPAAGPTDYFGVYSTFVPRHLEFDFHGWVDWANNPLELQSGTTFEDVVEQQTTLSLMANIGLFDRFEIGLLVPLTVSQSGGNIDTIIPDGSTGNELASFGVNDSRLTAKWRILDASLDALGLAVITNFYIPLASKNRLTSDEGFSFDGRLAAEWWLFRGMRIAANVGYRFRSGEPREFQAARMGDEVLWGIGFSLPLFISKLDALAEIDSGISTAPRPAGGIQADQVPTEFRLGARYKLHEDWTLTAGAGWGMTDAVGDPSPRLFVSVGGYWVSGGSWGFDYDGDGIYGYKDKCPEAAEDYDGHEDLDGCPDPDNDGDGVPDDFDKCDNTPDGFEVGKEGCPDNDLDGDGIPNSVDKCPEDPEDRDGFEDADGCPDPDNDGDGIPDTKDECPQEPENFNDLRDEDGCPDDPNQKVIVGRENIIIMDQVYFATNKDTILRKSYPILKEVAKVLNANEQIKRVRVEGHTDSRGKDEYNMDLSQRRANSVRKFLIREGVESERLEAVGFGETQPIADNETKEGRAKNRRSEFVILERE